MIREFVSPSFHEYMEPPCLGLFTREKFVGGASSSIGHQRAQNMCAHLEYRVQKELEQIEKAAKLAKVKLRTEELAWEFQLD